MIRLLDCTLRDGCHVNSGNFGYENIINIADTLTCANLDFVEIGFLRNVEYNKNFPFYPYIEQAYDVLLRINTANKTEYALMVRADEYNLNNLTECDGRIKLIRIAFYYDYFEKAIQFAKEIKAKGYNFTLNVINTPGNGTKDLIKMIDYANKITPEIVTIVDTFGVLDGKELTTLLKEYNYNLDKKIMIGLHVHENLALAFSLAKAFIEFLNNQRNITIDGSLLGMGRIPGNLPIELIADYINTNYGKCYKLADILRLIDTVIKPIKEELPWGYSPAYFLSAKYRVHRSYSEYMLKCGLSLNEINTLLSKIDPSHAEKFNKDFINSLIANDERSIR